MPDMFIPRANAFSQNPLDRMDARRRDADWIEANSRDPASLFVPVWRGKVLLRTPDGETPKPALSSGLRYEGMAYRRTLGPARVP